MGRGRSVTLHARGLQHGVARLQPFSIEEPVWTSELVLIKSRQQSAGRFGERLSEFHQSDSTFLA